MAVLVLKRQAGRAHTAALLASDTAEIPGKMVISGTTTSGTEVLRIQGETLLEGTLHGTLNGTGLIIGVAGASASTGSAIQIGSFTTTQRGNLASATGTAGMLIYNTTLTRFQNSNGLRWGDDSSNNFQATTDPSTANDITQGYTVGSLWINTSTKILWTCADSSTGAAVWMQGTKSKFSMALGGHLGFVALPFSGAGPEIADAGYTITSFKARRGVAGTSGTTTVQLELNGSTIGGATLSWTSSDAAFTLKTVTLSQAIVAGDRISFRLTAVEGGDPQDIYAEAN